MIAAIVLAAAVTSGAAPADAYFGRLKMSSLRIRYEVMQTKAHLESHKILPDSAEHYAELTQEAFEDWARKYPHDSWLPGTAFLFAQLYEELPGTAARDNAVHMLTFIVTKFPKSSVAPKARDALHRGIPVRPEPAWAAATPAPSPTPSTSSNAPASPTPSGTAAPSPTPSATPRATASPG